MTYTSAADSIERLFRSNIEGGYTEDPDDSAHYGAKDNRPGAEWDCFCTNMGITQATASAFFGRQMSAAEMRNLSPATARKIYLINYVYKPKFDRLPLSLQYPAINAGINFGPDDPSKWVQNIVNQYAKEDVLVVDGSLGPKSIAAIDKHLASADDDDLRLLFATQWLEAYDALAKAKKSNKKFLAGWRNRVREVFPDLPPTLWE